MRRERLSSLKDCEPHSSHRSSPEPQTSTKSRSALPVPPANTVCGSPWSRKESAGLMNCQALPVRKIFGSACLETVEQLLANSLTHYVFVNGRIRRGGSVFSRSAQQRPARV